MTPVLAAARYWARAVEEAGEAFGRRIRIDAAQVLDRGSELALGSPGSRSANRSARMVRAADGWLAVNLPRAEDLEMLPALLERAIDGDPWRALILAVREHACAEIRDRARLLGLPISTVGEVAAPRVPVPVQRFGVPRSRSGPVRVVDLTSLWAGPLCAALLAEAGAEVTRYESLYRPDPTREAAPRFYHRLNGTKTRMTVDFGSAAGRAILAEAIAGADIVITSARARAFDALGLSPEAMFARNPGLVWVAITGHGWASDRVAFGDDAAAAGGLVRWTQGGAPRFLGDAIADPLTGMAGAAAAMRAMADGGGVLIDAALARVAAASHKPVE